MNFSSPALSTPNEKGTVHSGTAQGRAALLPATSQRIRLMRLPLIVGVVFVHSAETSVTLAHGQVGVEHVGAIEAFIVDLISNGLGRSAVPLSLVFAGYLLAHGMDSSFGGYVRRLQSKVHSLLLPMLFWNVFALLLHVVAQALPSTAGFFSGRHTLVADYSAAQLVQALTGLGGPPIAYHFWFIKDLLLLVVLSPLLRRGLTTSPLTILVALFLLWQSELWTTDWLSVKAAFFFCVGLHLGTNGIPLSKLDNYARPIVCLYALLLVICALPWSEPWRPALHPLTISLGACALWCLSGWVVRTASLQKHLLTWSSASFFVFAAHEPLLTVVRKLAYTVVQPHSAWVAMALYFVVPLCLVAGLIALHRQLSRLFPSFTGFITGGRKSNREIRRRQGGAPVHQSRSRGDGPISQLDGLGDGVRSTVRHRSA
jgi:surface polysaccharide O-acyltransferase-like enzyme